MTAEKRFRTCPLCEATCGLALTVEPESRRVLRVEGDAEDPFSRGFICPKGAALAELDADPDRLRQPMVRRDGRLVETTWDDAFAAVEAGLNALFETHGRAALGAYLGNPNVHNLSGVLYVRPLLKALRARAIFSASTMDQMPRHAVSGWLYGRPGAFPVPDLDRTDLLVIFGANPWVSNGSLCTAPDFPGRLKAIQRRGGRFVVFDPRRTATARRADAHHFIRPGSDAAVLLAILREVVAVHGARVPDHLAGAVDGLDQIGPLVDAFTPERAAEASGVDAETIRSLARDLVETPRASVYARLGVHTSGFGSLAQWAVDVINLVCGNLDVPGGAMFSEPAHEPARTAPETSARWWSTGRWASRVAGHPEVLGELPVAALPEEILTPGDGRLRGLLTIAGNVARSAPASESVERALADLEFMVSVDAYLNETTRFADVILPPPPPLQRGHYDLAFYSMSVRNVANYSAPVFPAEADRPAEWEILLRLTAIALGQGASAPIEALDDMGFALYAQKVLADPTLVCHGTPMTEVGPALDASRGPERLLDFMLRAGRWGAGFGDHGGDGALCLEHLRQHPHGLDLGPLEPRLPAFLRTPEHRLRVVPEVIPAEVERFAARAPAAETVLIGRRHLRSNNSWMHNVPRLATGHGRCDLFVHPDDAARLGVEDGGRARVSGRLADSSLEARVAVTEDVMPGVVCLPHGWGHDAADTRLGIAAEHPGVNVNRIVAGELDRASGNAQLNGIAVEVEPA